MSMLSKIELKLTKYAAETLIYFEKHKIIEIVKKILVECALLRPSNPQEWIGLNIKRVANEIYQDCLHQGENEIVKALHLSTKFLYRILIFGRAGCGSKTQAQNLVAAFNLVLIDAETLIYQSLRGVDERPEDPLDRELQRAFYYGNCLAKSKAILNIIARRILEEDCLNRGWVLINFAHTLHDFKEILQNFETPPNKLVYLKCDERTSMYRLLNMPSWGKTSQNHRYYELEMGFFNLNKADIVDYLLKRYETICITAAENSEKVKTHLMSSIMKSSYVMGFKQNIGE